MPEFSQNDRAIIITQELNSIKATEEVFSVLLKKQPYYEVTKATSNIIFGNPDAGILVTILTNPHCAPCANMHKRIETLLEQANNNICVQYIYSSFSKELDSSNQFLIAVYLDNSEKSQSIYQDWFEFGKNDKEEFIGYYAFDTNTESVQKEFKKHEYWKELTGLRATPTILVNGYKLPDNYKIEDIKYFTKIDL